MEHRRSASHDVTESHTSTIVSLQVSGCRINYCIDMHVYTSTF